MNKSHGHLRSHSPLPETNVGREHEEEQTFRALAELLHSLQDHRRRGDLCAFVLL